MKKFIDCVNAKIKAILEQKEEEKAAAKEALDAAEARANTAAKAWETAVKACDPVALHAAKTAQAQAEDEAAMYRQKMMQLSSKRKISAQENKETMAEIRAVQEALKDECSQKILELMKEIESISKQYYQDQDALNELIIKWHRNIYTQPHPRRKGCDADVWDLKIKDSDLRGCIVDVVTNYFYRAHRGLGQYPGGGNIWT